MNNGKAKRLRNTAKKKCASTGAVWVEYNPTTYHKVGELKDGTNILFVDPITMNPQCGRKQYQGTKKK